MAEHAHQQGQGTYPALAIEMSIDFVIMYFVMYTMIATVDHLRLNVNNVYMTLMMVAPMTIVMLVGMRSMFPSKRMNLLIGAIAAFVFLASFGAMRTQAAVGDEQFLKSMIPHHSGAILMCKEASLRDRQIIELCKNIVQSQQAEIEQMQALLARF